MSITQGEAVHEAVRSVFPDGAVPETKTWTSDQKNTVNSILMQMFLQGVWVKNSGGTDAKAMAQYLPGLVNNWVRKDPRLNGGVKYEAKNPGIRHNAGDAQIRAMRQLLSVTKDEGDKLTIQNAIAEREEELKPKIDITLLPESLRHLVK